MDFVNPETLKVTRRTPRYRVKEITEALEKVTEQLSTLHDHVQEERSSLFPPMAGFIERLLRPKPMKRFELVRTAGQHFDQAFFTLQEHPLAKPASIWLAKPKCKTEKGLDGLEELETEVLKVLSKIVTLLEDCNRAIGKDHAWMSKQLRRDPSNENETGTAKVLNEGQQQVLASELDRKTYMLRHIVYRLIAMNGGETADAHGPVPRRTEEGLRGSWSAMFDDSTEKFSMHVAEATASSTWEMLRKPRKKGMRLWS
ncbi:hypothetical protein E6O75_ATG08482 [Venturia nashicola]|uniref:Uncharacterized protein n=1 Tax=Venturia nashicola TaxID=86259 RepID=A0A4Z1NHR0_9PEZI|nr:hypothetical protein E6O75_ATG08482 [Venturia nashicola]